MKKSILSFLILALSFLFENQTNAQTSIQPNLKLLQSAGLWR